jgi:hypothetical protein
MVINMNETRLTTILQIEEFLRANAAVDFLPSGDDAERYPHIRRVLKRFDYIPSGRVMSVASCCVICA